MEQTKELFGFAFELGESVAKSLEDGKIGFEDLANFMGAFAKVGPAIDGISEVKDEISNMTPEQRVEFVAWAKADFDIADDGLEAKVEAVLEAGLKILELVNVFR